MSVQFTPMMHPLIKNAIAKMTFAEVKEDEKIIHEKVPKTKTKMEIIHCI